MGIQKESAVPIVEPAFVPDTFATRLARVEKVPGGLVRCTYVAEQETDDGIMEIVVCRLVRPASAFGAGRRMLETIFGPDWDSPSNVVWLR